MKTIKARIFFGKKISRAVDEGNMRLAETLLADGEGTYVERKFNTEAEREAYFQGIADMDGWEDCFSLEDSKPTPNWATAFIQGE